MLATGGVQCGFCTPGFVVSLAALLDEVPDPSESQIHTALGGNLCRCTGYYSIVAAALEAARATAAVARRADTAGDLGTDTARRTDTAGDLGTTGAPDNA